MLQGLPPLVLASASLLLSLHTTCIFRARKSWSYTWFHWASEHFPVFGRGPLSRHGSVMSQRNSARGYTSVWWYGTVNRNWGFRRPVCTKPGKSVPNWEKLRRYWVTSLHLDGFC